MSHDEAGRPKYSQILYGGLGNMDTRAMNEVLLGKWLRRMLNDNKDDLCYTLLKNKYFQKNHLCILKGI